MKLSVKELLSKFRKQAFQPPAAVHVQEGTTLHVEGQRVGLQNFNDLRFNGNT